VIGVTFVSLGLLRGNSSTSLRSCVISSRSCESKREPLGRIIIHIMTPMTAGQANSNSKYRSTKMVLPL